MRWDYFTEQHAFSCADGSPRCPLRGADRADVADVLGAALEELNRRYHPALRLQKQQLVNGYRRFDPARGMEYTLDLQLEALTPQGGRRPLTRRVQLLRPLSRVEILPVPYVTEASRLTVLLPLAAAERDLAPASLSELLPAPWPILLEFLQLSRFIPVLESSHPPQPGNLSLSAFSM